MPEQRYAKTPWVRGWTACILTAALLFAAPCFSSKASVANGAATAPANSNDPHASDAYFALDRVLDVAIEIAPAAWDSLRDQERTLVDILGGADCLDHPPDDIFTWFKATVRVDGETHTQVGVRKKGFFGSMSNTKPSLKIRFDKFVDHQLLGGVMQRLTLNNVRQDKSKLNTCLAYRVFAAAGLPAPRCNFATVSVNGKNLGLYAHVESIKKGFLQRNFASARGNLYEGTLSDFRSQWRRTFQKKTNENTADWSDIDAAVKALQDPSPAGQEALAAVIDIDTFLSFWALEVIVGHWDGYTGNRNNYYIYRPPNAPFVFIPWGADAVFSTNDSPFDSFKSPPSVSAHGAIAHRLYRQEATRQAYVLRLRQLLDTVWNETELLALTDQMAAIVQTHALAKARQDASNDTKRVRRFIHRRRGAILDDLDPQPPAWPWPLVSADICWDFGAEASTEGEDDPSKGPDEFRADIGLIINEVAARGEPLDWFELHNASQEPVEMAGLVLADDLNDLSRRVAFPADMVIDAGAYQLIQLDKNAWPGFALGSGEELGIWTADGLLVDLIDWEDGQSAAATSLARLPDVIGDFQTVDQPTPGAPNRLQTAIIAEATNRAQVFQLHGNWPNPFNANTVIAFDLAGGLPVRLVVYDTLGRRVHILRNGEMLAAGHYRIAWDGLDDRGRPAASGVYLYRLNAGTDLVAVGRMALIR